MIKIWDKIQNKQNVMIIRISLRAILFFEDEPIKTYKILSNLLDKEVNSLYLINMLNAYFKAYENDENKEEKFSDILEKYNGYAKRLQNHKKVYLNIKRTLWTYRSIKDEKKFVELWIEMPKQYQYDFRILKYDVNFYRKTINLLLPKIILMNLIKSTNQITMNKTK